MDRYGSAQSAVGRLTLSFHTIMNLAITRGLKGMNIQMAMGIAMAYPEKRLQTSHTAQPSPLVPTLWRQLNLCFHQ